MQGNTSAQSVTDDIAFFFSEPYDDYFRNENGDERGSVLAMLRQEAIDCLVGLGKPWMTEDQVAAHPSRYNRLFASAMVMLAGIDLFGKFLAGDDSRGKVEARFTGFARQFNPRTA